MRNVELLAFADGTIETGSARQVSVPSIVGQTQEAAALASGRLLVGDVTFESSDTVAAGSVVRQTPAPGESAASGTPVALVSPTLTGHSSRRSSPAAYRPRPAVSGDAAPHLDQAPRRPPERVFAGRGGGWADV
ncbi:PASTA domain-containing protein [Sorangium sp. So ce513]|uniref:PASTA domain-containing protein n=1 Tax=Sorangium sp. So ce513 TaxID=3133315 RepID=UPI003F60D7C1